MVGRICCVSLVVAALGTSAVRAGAPGFPPLAGMWWRHLAPAEKQLWLGGFLAGAAVDSAAVPPERRFRYAATLYASQLDDYYWWSDRVDTPVVDALSTINQELTTH
jgi:hypothetical protein